MLNGNHDHTMIAAEGLTKLYGSHVAIDDITFSCKKGEIVGFLGPNGSGKTTTMRILTGYMPPTSGAAYIAGHDTLADSIAARKRLGYLPETVPLYSEMTVESYLAFVGRVRKVEDLWNRINDVLEAVNLLDRAESFISSLSKGMRQRLGLAQALIHDPDVLILDEPTIGLDPRQVVEIRELIKELGSRHTILLSTHILSEVEQICDRVIMIINGRIWADMPLTQLVSGSEARQLSLLLAHPATDSAAQLQAVAGVESVSNAGSGRFTVVTDGRDETRLVLGETVVSAGWGLLELSSIRRTLESVFLDKLREAEAVTSELSDVSEQSIEEEE